MKIWFWRTTIVVLLIWALIGLSSAHGELVSGTKAPSFTAVDIRGQEVNLDKILQAQPNVIILYFFRVETGKEVAVRLRQLDRMYGASKIKVVAIGLKEEEQALKTFADELSIEYYILKDTEKLKAEDLYGPFRTIPMTYILQKNPKTQEATVAEFLRGSGKGEADIISATAKRLLMQGDTEAAVKVAGEAAKEGEDPKKAAEIAGFALVKEGKLDAAESEFKKFDIKEGEAAVALERGNLDQAKSLADQAGPNSGAADVIKGRALMREGKLDDAAKVLEGAASKPAMEFHTEEAIIGQGRVKQEKGDLDGAIGTYDKAFDLNPYSVTALSNEGAAHRQKGDLKEAAEALDTAQKIGGDKPDPLVAMMLRQIQDEMKKANDVKRGELIRQQIDDLKKRYDELKAAGKDKPTDDWTSRPLVIAFLPSESASRVFFERAGMDVALRRGVELRLRESGGRIQVVEREMLDKLLQELNLGSSEVANPDTQLRLGKVLSAQMLGFIDYSQAGPDTTMYLRMVDSETTSISSQLTKSLKGAGDLDAWVSGVVDELSAQITGDNKLQGRIAKVDGDSVLINLGDKHGLRPGQRFAVLQDGEPIVVGGKTLQGKATKVATLELTEVDGDLATCKVVEKSESTKLAKEMKIKEITKK